MLVGIDFVRRREHVLNQFFVFLKQVHLRVFEKARIGRAKLRQSGIGSNLNTVDGVRLAPDLVHVLVHGQFAVFIIVILLFSTLRLQHLSQLLLVFAYSNEVLLVIHFVIFTQNITRVYAHFVGVVAQFGTLQVPSVIRWQLKVLLVKVRVLLEDVHQSPRIVPFDLRKVVVRSVRMTRLGRLLLTNLLHRRLLSKLRLLVLIEL